MIVIIYDCHIFIVQSTEKIPKLEIINFSNFLVSTCRKDSNLNAFLATFASLIKPIVDITVVMLIVTNN
jgi:hypothetical protein